MRKATDQQLIEAYKKFGNTPQVAKQFGMCHQSVWERLKKLNVNLNGRAYSSEEIEKIKRSYVLYRDAGKLKVLAKKLGREKCNLCRKAKELGLTNRIHPHNWARWNKVTKDEAEIMFSQFKKSSLGLNPYCENKSIPISGFTKTMKKYFPDEWDSVIELKAPKQSRYRLGRHVEYTVRDAFKALGYLVFRSPRSRGITDLVAISKGIIVFIQCKRGMTVGVKEWNKLYQISKSVNAVPLIAGRPTGRGIQYWLITAEKDGTRKPQPKIDIKIEDLKSFTTTKSRELRSL